MDDNTRGRKYEGFTGRGAIDVFLYEEGTISHETRMRPDVKYIAPTLGHT